MNNKVKVKKLTGKTSHTRALKRALLTDLILYEHIETTAGKAKVVAPMVDKVIGIAKKYDKRMATNKLSKVFFNEKATEKVLEVLISRFKEETSGYVKLYKIGNRKGDNAPLIKMILKGYVYKEIGAASSKKKTKAKEEKEIKGYEVDNVKNIDSSQSQVGIKGSQGKAKSRSGI